MYQRTTYHWPQHEWNTCGTSCAPHSGVNRVTRPALRGSILGNILRLLNPVVKFLLGSPLHWPLSRWFALVAWTGRKSGRRYSTPVSYVREGDVAWVTTGDRWWRNLEGGAPAAMRIGGRWHEGAGGPVADQIESQAIHERLFRAYPWFRWLSGIPRDRNGGPDSAALRQALSAGRVLVRFDLGS